MKHQYFSQALVFLLHCTSVHKPGALSPQLQFVKLVFNLMSNFLEIDFMIKTDDKKLRRFDLSEVIFKCELKMYK